MSTIVLPMMSSPLKRSATEAELDPAPSRPNEPQTLHVLKNGDRDDLSGALLAPVNAVTGTDKDPPSAPSKAPLMPDIAAPDQGLSPHKAHTAPSTTNPAKRRKLTFAEKEAQKIEKAHKELQKKEELARKEEEKAKKEEEKKAREQEKRAKDELKESERKKREEEKEEKRKAKEAEKAAKGEEKKKKDAEKEAKDGEKLKKERAQLRLNSFFTNPKSSPFKGPDSPLQGENLIPSRRNSVASASNGGSKASSRASSICPEPRKLDWERCFPPFFLHAHTTLAPFNRFGDANRSRKLDIDSITKQLDALIEGSSRDSLMTLTTTSLLPMPKRSKLRSIQRSSTKDIIARINGTPVHPIDLTKSSPEPAPLQLLQALPIKYLKYCEDVRPPYVGTYTRRPTSPRSFSKICRRPCVSRVLPDTNYDYDSEAEWEEPGEGEDLNSEGELDDEGDDDADDMDGFLDDEGAEQARKRVFGGDMVPMQTGMCWDDGAKGKREVGFGVGKLDLKTMSIEGLLADLTFPIDPYSTAYWPSSITAAPPTTLSSSATAQPSTVTKTAPTQSRLPLNAVSTSASNLPFPHLAHVPQEPSKLSSIATCVSNVPVAGSSPATAGKPPKKPFPSELLPDLKKAVEGSDLTKAGLVEILKKRPVEDLIPFGFDCDVQELIDYLACSRFPKVGKDAIHYTLGLIAERVGKTEVEKRWVLR